MIKECNTVKEFVESCKEYFKYHYSRYTCSENERDMDLITGISFKITDPNLFLDKDVRELFHSNVSILDDTLPLLGKQYGEGVLLGIEATEEDFYYILKREDGSLYYESCVGKL